MAKAVPAVNKDVPAAGRTSRLDVVDWLRGLAVVLMIQTHLYDAWVHVGAKKTAAYAVTRYLGGIPARLFLLLVGVSLALRFEAHLRKGTPRAAICAESAKRGLAILVLAYVFRAQEYLLGGMGDNWPDIFRIDILNCIGVSLMLVPLFAAPIGGRPAYAASLLAAAVFVGLGPIVGPARFPDVVPREITAYIGGQRPLAWFSLFPWAAWPLCGVVVGHFWARASTSPARQARAFIVSGVVGATCTLTVVLIRMIDPHVIRYPSEIVQQMGPGAFFYRVGLVGVLATIGWAILRVTRRADGTLPFSIMRQFGLTSLLVYWIHVDLCYGLISKRFHGHLDMAEATVGFAAMTAAMLSVSLARTRVWDPWWKKRRRWRTTRA